VTRPVLLDTGPLIAALDRRDGHHGWAKAQFDRLGAPFLTYEAVLSKSCFLLGKVPGGS
jgi:predicted nucleic acid-binding protein